MFSLFREPQAFPHVVVRILSVDCIFPYLTFRNLYFLLRQRRESRWMLFFAKNCNNYSSTFLQINHILRQFKQFFKNISSFNQEGLANRSIHNSCQLLSSIMFVWMRNPINVFSELFFHAHIVTYAREYWNQHSHWVCCHWGDGNSESNSLWGVKNLLPRRWAYDWVL